MIARRLLAATLLVVSCALAGTVAADGSAAAGISVAAGTAEQPPARLEPLPRAAPSDPARRELGRQLFFESRLSGDGSRSCATCHSPSRGFSDGDALSRGYNHTGHFRNTPGLIGLRLKSRLMWDGRHGRHEIAAIVLDMLVSPVTMNGDRAIVVERVRQIPVLLRAWERAHGEQTLPALEGIVEALAEYALAHDGGDTPVDAALRGETAALPARAADGMRLFAGKAGCVRCHSGAALSDGRTHRLGVPENPEILRDPERTISLLRHHAMHGSPDPMAERSDTGVHATTRRNSDRGRFATPSLRGVAHTAPYMHNGVLPDLAAVVSFYDRGGGRGSDLKPLGLDASERAALVAFLEALSPELAAETAPEADDYATVAGAGR